MVGADEPKKSVTKVYPQMVSISHCVNTAVGTTVLNSGPLNHLFSFFSCERDHTWHAWRNSGRARCEFKVLRLPEIWQLTGGNKVVEERGKRKCFALKREELWRCIQGISWEPCNQDCGSPCYFSTTVFASAECLMTFTVQKPAMRVMKSAICVQKVETCGSAG